MSTPYNPQAVPHPCTARIPGTLECCNVPYLVTWSGSNPKRQPHDCRATTPRETVNENMTNEDQRDYMARAIEKGAAATTAINAPERVGYQLDEPPTVKRATLFDGVVDSFQTEGELNGFKPKQGALL